jgi:phospholipid/cholesterol/gamma-HCH transport system ATP-binding protein
MEKKQQSYLLKLNEEKVPVIEIKGLVKSFGENNHVLKGLSLSLNRGKIW